jgi:hypothetical protein
MQKPHLAARQFRRSPGFFFSAALLVALSVAANARIFTLVNVFLVQVLPARDPGNLIQLSRSTPGGRRSHIFTTGFTGRSPSALQLCFR